MGLGRLRFRVHRSWAVGRGEHCKSSFKGPVKGLYRDSIRV